MKIFDAVFQIPNRENKIFCSRYFLIRPSGALFPFCASFPGFHGLRPFHPGLLSATPPALASFKFPRRTNFGAVSISMCFQFQCAVKFNTPSNVSPSGAAYL
jgi:hypothetical protein